MEEHERIRRSMTSFYSIWGSRLNIQDITSDEKDCSSASTEDRKDEEKALEPESLASSDVRNLLVHLQQNALLQHGGLDGQDLTKAVDQ